MQTASMLLPEMWVDKYSDKLFRYALTRTGDTWVAEDIVQETFLSAWRAKDNFKGGTSEKNWLYAICKNKIVDHFRKQANSITKTVMEEETIYFDEHEHWRKSPAPKAWSVNQHQQIENKEFFVVLDLCKKKLKDIQQSIFVMKYLEDMDADKICKTLDISISNYWVLIHRCKLHLRSCLEKNWIKI